MRKIKKLIGILVIVYLLGGVLIFAFQRKIIYQPNSQIFENCQEFANAQNITWQKTRMYVKNNSNRWLVFYHGNAGSACDRSHFLSFLDSTNYSYIFVEYTGYSSDPGTPSETELLKNVKAVNTFLETQQVSEIILIGESLGTALAAYHSHINQPKKILLISPFTNLSDIATDHFWFYPTKLLLSDKYPVSEWLSSAENIVIIHGTNDQVIPFHLGKKLFGGLATKNKNFVEIKSAGHNDIYDFDLTRSTIKTFLAD